LLAQCQGANFLGGSLFSKMPVIQSSGVPYFGSLPLLSWIILCNPNLLNSEQLQAIIKKDWKKLEQLNKKQHD
jgi:hypothetical protein